MIDLLEGNLLLISRLSIMALQFMGAVVLVMAAVRIFSHYLKLKFTESSTEIRMRFARAISLALEFYLAAEILATVFVRELGDLYIVAAIIVLRILLAFVIQRELKLDLEELRMEKDGGGKDETQ